MVGARGRQQTRNRIPTCTWCNSIQLQRILNACSLARWKDWYWRLGKQAHWVHLTISDSSWEENRSSQADGRRSGRLLNGLRERSPRYLWNRMGFQMGKKANKKSKASWLCYFRWRSLRVACARHQSFPRQWRVVQVKRHPLQERLLTLWSTWHWKDFFYSSSSRRTSPQFVLP